MPHYQFPCNYVYWEKLSEHEKLKSEILPVIKNIKNTTELKNPFASCQFTTNFNYKNTMEKFLSNEQINSIIWKPIDNMIKEINETYNFKISTQDSIVQTYWFNYYEKGDFQEAHNHRNASIRINDKTYHASFSVIYIINDENDESSTTFTAFTDSFPPFLPPHISPAFKTSSISDIKEGCVIIFPSTLSHHVDPIKVGGRITMAFNIYSTY